MKNKFKEFNEYKNIILNNYILLFRKKKQN